MRLLLIGPLRENVVLFLESYGDIVEHVGEIIGFDSIKKYDFIISYGYRYILNKEITEKFHNKIINLHISYLPWNRGSDPNLWSFLEDSPKGVSIHYIDEGLDTGLIIAQEKIDYSPDDTLKTTYERLCSTIEKLFFEIWPSVRSGKCTAYKQIEGGSSHKLKDKDKYLHLLYSQWNTPVEHIIGKAGKRGEYE